MLRGSRRQSDDSIRQPKQTSFVSFMSLRDVLFTSYAPSWVTDFRTKRKVKISDGPNEDLTSSKEKLFIWDLRIQASRNNSRVENNRDLEKEYKTARHKVPRARDTPRLNLSKTTSMSKNLRKCQERRARTSLEETKENTVLDFLNSGSELDHFQRHLKNIRSTIKRNKRISRVSESRCKRNVRFKTLFEDYDSGELEPSLSPETNIFEIKSR
ncbi:hypothetical protein CHS0354_008865 [Potamilus streckersoni]|uniref:Uncharacterized protein n=1 Tax=Potamilus streckersoni TaxID=2493646 RepID=A0AAE0RUF4_9BIVA|nr:hypothetical protein CHS0354_008865 [Potamilus streckersoni]